MFVMVIENIILNGVQGQQPTLSQARFGLAATSVGKYALFGGGQYGSEYSNVVDIWNSETNTWTVTFLSQTRNQLAATSNGESALFAGGYKPYSNPHRSNVVDIWSNSTWNTNTLSSGRSGLGATSAGMFSLFGGGFSDSGTLSTALDIWNRETKTWVTSTLSPARNIFSSATSVRQFCLFGGGEIHNCKEPRNTDPNPRPSLTP
jgi:hypothetical protein